MKIKLLSILLVLAFILSLSSCAVTNDTTDTETTETEDTEAYKRLRIEASEWAEKEPYTTYAIVKIKDSTSDTIQINDSDFYYQRFTYRQIYSSRKGFTYDGSLYIAQDPEQKIDPGDSVFLQVDYLPGSSPKIWYAKSGSRPMSEYKIFTDGTIEFTDDDFKNDVFYLISVFNKHVSEKREWSKSYDTDPSFPTKELYGKVTVEEVSDFFDSVKKARDEYFAFWDDPESVNEYLKQFP